MPAATNCSPGQATGTNSHQSRPKKARPSSGNPAKQRLVFSSDSAGIPELDFYLAFNLFRFAAIVHGNKGRMARGNAASREAGDPVRHLDLFAGLGRRLAEPS
jgi:hypothetical protein